MVKSLVCKYVFKHFWLDIDFSVFLHLSRTRKFSWFGFVLILRENVVFLTENCCWYSRNLSIRVRQQVKKVKSLYSLKSGFENKITFILFTFHKSALAVGTYFYINHYRSFTIEWNRLWWRRYFSYIFETETFSCTYTQSKYPVLQ